MKEYNELKSVVNDIIKKLAGDIKFTIPAGIVITYIKEIYDKGLLDMEKKYSMNFQRDKSKLELMQDYVSDNIKDMEKDMIDKVRKEVTMGVINKESVKDIEKRITKVTKVSKTRAEAIARTESNRVYNMAHKDAAIQSGRTHKKVDVHIDNRTSPICMRMNAKYGSNKQAIPINSKFVDNKTGEKFDTSPFHVNCRTRITYLTKEEIKNE